mgnify:CR=1 FL=1
MENNYFEVSYQPTEQEIFEYNIKVSRDIYNWYEIIKNYNGNSKRSGN